MHLPHTEGTVLPEWIDANGHMNLAYYVVLFDRATAAIYHALGIGDAYRTASGRSPFAVEMHTLYEREMRAGERVRISSRLLGADSKRLHYFHQMFHAEQGHRVAAQELMALHIDLNVRKATPFAPDIQERLQNAVNATAGEPLPLGIGRRITSLDGHRTPARDQPQGAHANADRLKAGLS